MKLDLLTSLYVFMLAAFIGFEVIRRVSPLLHTPLMSLTNALDAIAVVGAIILAGEYHAHGAMLAKILGTIAIVAATSNIVGGFLITDRMLKMFKASGRRIHDQPARHGIHHRNHLSDCHRAFHSVAEVAELSDDGAPRRLRRRAGNVVGHCRNSAAPGHRGIQMDLHRPRVRHDYWRAARRSGHDRGAAADGSEPRVWGAVRDAGRHSGVLFAHSRC